MENKSIPKELRSISLWRWLGAALFDWAVIAAAFYAAYRIKAWWGYIPAAFIIATRQHALAILGHDGTHYLACKNHRLNDLLSNVLCYWPFLMSVEGYRDFHFLHHRTTGTANDPELAARKDQAPLWDIPKSRRAIALEALKDILGLRAHYFSHIYYHLTFKRNLSKKAIAAPLIFSSAVILMLIYFQLHWAIFLWFISLGTFFMCFFNLRTWTEHIGTRGTHRLSAHWWQEWCYLPHKTWMHWEHHEYPYVPYWKLVEVRRLKPEPPIIPADELFKSFAAAKPVPSGVLPD